MPVTLLELDDAFDGQEAFLLPLAASNLLRMDLRALGPALRLWSRPRALGILASRLGEAMAGQGPGLVFMGSGDFHHVSAVLIERAIALAPERPLTVVHFDNHPDWVKFTPGLHCGSWAAHVARLNGVHQVITIGLCSGDLDDDGSKGADISVVREGRQTLFPLRSGGKEDRVIGGRLVPSIESLGDTVFLERLDAMIGGNDVYITIDKDVLSPLDAATNWDQGQLRLDRMLAWIEAIASDRCMRGADVTGDCSKPVYGPHPLAAAVKWVEARMDQPARPATSSGHALNTAGNIAIHRCLAPYFEG